MSQVNENTREKRFMNEYIGSVYLKVTAALYTKVYNIAENMMYILFFCAWILGYYTTKLTVLGNACNLH